MFRSVKDAVFWGLAHRGLEGIGAIGVDEIQWRRGQKYLTLVYQIDEEFQRFWEYLYPACAAKFLDEWCTRTMRSKIEPMKKVAKTLRRHRELILN